MAVLDKLTSTDPQQARFSLFTVDALYFITEKSFVRRQKWCLFLLDHM